MSFDDNDMELFQEIVVDKIVCTEFGSMELPLYALREYHEMLNLPPEKTCLLSFNLPDGEEGFYNYILGFDCDIETTIMVTDVFYYDEQSDSSHSIGGDKRFYNTLFCNLCSGAALICGEMMIDEQGYLYIRVSQSDDIFVEYRINLRANSAGFQFIKSDLTDPVRIWSDGDKVFVVPVQLTYTGDLLS